MFNLKSLKVLVIGSLLTISSVAMALPATDSATVDLSGNVQPELEVTAVATTGAGFADALDLSGGEHIVKVADISTITNNEQGFSITTSDGNLIKTGGTSIAYVTTLVADEGTAPANTVFDNPLTGRSTAGTTDQDLYIMYSPATLQDPGDYTGQITVTVTDL